jgi:hypothetical protein
MVYVAVSFVPKSSDVSITKEAGTTAQAIQSNAGIKVYSVLPFFEDTNLNELCPGSPPPLVLADTPEENDGQNAVAGTNSNINKTNQDESSGLEGWAVGLISLLGVILVGSLAFLYVIYDQERRGQPCLRSKWEHNRLKKEVN